MYVVLHILAGSDAGGIQRVVLNYYRHLDRSKIRFDVALTTEQVGFMEQEMQALGAEYFRLPLKSKGIKQFESELKKLLSQRRYDAIHVHENVTSFVALRIARQMGVPVRIAHSHTSAPAFSVQEEVKRLVGCVLNAQYATCLIGCGRLAGERVFGKRAMRTAKAVVLPNAIDTDRFAFSQSVRAEMRARLGLEDRFVVGMIGRLSPEKNHEHALRVMKKLSAAVGNAVLVLAGSGECEAKIRELIRAQGLEKNVVMLGPRADVDQLYQAFDAYIMPSVHEGFPVAAVEAMTSGLPVLLSARITDELNFGSARYLKLEDEDVWVNALREISEKPVEDRECAADEVRRHGLDIRDTAQQLEDIYLTRR